MKKILYLTFYYQPDLCAGSFRNSPLVRELSKQFEGEIELITTMPNRYNSYQALALPFEKEGNVTVHRVTLPKHKSGMGDQIKAFEKFYSEAKKITRNKNYDLVFASSSRLFTAFLGYRIAKKINAPLYLDIRDIFTDTMKDVLKSPILKAVALPVLNTIERKVFGYASHINLISEGFKPYFTKYSQAKYSAFTNGIDNEFLALPATTKKNSLVKLITYAGNLGDGQGLHKIIPIAAKMLGEAYKFLVIGDGGAKQQLIDEIEGLKVTNVTLMDPVKREELISRYLESDFLFIHLNDYDAFKKVLPSKVFELSSFDKPLIAGVAGYANQFIEEHVSNKILFLPGDVDEMVNQIKNYEYSLGFRSDFIDKFKRSNIDKKMAESILSYIK